MSGLAVFGLVMLAAFLLPVPAMVLPDRWATRYWKTLAVAFWAVLVLGLLEGWESHGYGRQVTPYLLFAGLLGILGLIVHLLPRRPR